MMAIGLFCMCSACCYIQIIYWFVRSYSTKIKLRMYKAGQSYTRSSQNIPHPSLPSPNNRNMPYKFPSPDRLDLRKFNEYLEDKISRKVHKSRMNQSKRGEVEPNNYSHINAQYEKLKNNARLVVQKSSQFLGFQASRPPSAPKYKSPNIRQESDHSNSKVQWKRHQSIEKLLEKQNKFTENSIRKQPMPELESNSTELMEEKYQELQYKYQKLVKETIISNKQYEENQKELQILKKQHLQDQETLMELKSELMGIHHSKPKQSFAPQNQSKNVQTIHSQQIIESDVSISNSELPRKSWKSKQIERQDLKASNVYSKGNRTTESWMSKANANGAPQFPQPSSRYEQQVHKSRNSEKDDEKKSYRYYSADKMSSNTRRNSKNKKSDIVQYTQIQSKTTIKFGQSLTSSKVKIPEKFIDHKYEPQKSITPTTLHKKMMNSNHYSKYRFQPTVRLN